MTSRHVLAAVLPSPSPDGSEDPRLSSLRAAFQRATSELPCEWWSGGPDGRVHLASDYPDCILEGRDFTVLCGGLPYRVQNSFGWEGGESDDDARRPRLYDTSGAGDDDGAADAVTSPSPSPPSLARCVLLCAEGAAASVSPPPADRDASRVLSAVGDAVGRRLSRVSGHFAALVCHKPSGSLLVFNDPFGFMPVFRSAAFGDDGGAAGGVGGGAGGRAGVVLSSSWDCLWSAPGFAGGGTPLLDVDVVAEYLTLGTTLGGGGGTRTLCRGVENMNPGACLTVHVRRTDDGDGVVISTEQRRYTQCFGACELLFEPPEGTDPNGDNNDHKFLETGSSNTLPAEIQESHRQFEVIAAANASARESWPSRLMNCFSAPDPSKKVLVEPPEKHEKRLKAWKAKKAWEITSTQLSSDVCDDDHHHSDNQRDNGNGDDNCHLVLKAYVALQRAVRQAMRENVITKAALTGGGDTRLCLACLTPVDLRRLQFHTHDRQESDVTIARCLAKKVGLHHRTKQNTSIAPRIGRKTKSSEEVVLRLHDLEPQRRRRHGRGMSSLHDEENVAINTMHGRFGTELLGFLCFDKTSLPVRSTNDVDSLAPRAAKSFHAMFSVGSDEHGGEKIDNEDPCIVDNGGGGAGETKIWGGTNTICNPVHTLKETVAVLEQEREILRNHLECQEKTREKQLDDKEMFGYDFDVWYALQIQLFTRALLCDIYGGLRGGSMFAMPSAYFTRGQFSPFLDSSLLRLLLCRLPPQNKMDAYEWYGKLYRQCVPRVLQETPCNNKLLSMHTGMQHAIKVMPERPTLLSPMHPDLFEASQQQSTTRRRRKLCREPNEDPLNGNEGAVGIVPLRQFFNPVFWDGAIAIALSSPLKMNSDEISSDTRPEVQTLVHMVGANEAGVLSARLASFVLWYERRFLGNYMASTQPQKTSVAK